ncbi:NAD-dependent epimerase/dehydratase family protein [Jatrophihabitans cynanchi]|uniref:UDP-glucose 4-epimerase n=1 Tax=Jatrophihabitans cynanchi TaxID=2944128 RepID=A0ABY7K2F6_9ACTN|nr:NAD-dependent epimerase/dehydratase family protein [Jatrophihabitans sp. SB3-54]WAX59036.1 NAD-dependent epimerase/dehydratase family protein [Jatrophihabitans sp. SB3-54]
MGGTRMMGDATVRHLLAAGHHVSVFNRGSRVPDWADHVSQLRGDRDVPTDLAQIAGLDIDTIVDFSAYRGAQTASLVKVLPEAVHLVHCSTGAVYAPVPQLPWAEDSPIGPWDLWGDYAREKLNTEQAARTAATGERTVTIFRLPYVLGPRNYAPREEFVLNRLLDGEEVLLPGDGKAVQHFITAEQVGESVNLLVCSRPEAGVAVYNIADQRGLCTTEGFVQLCAEAADVAVRIRPVPGPTGAEGPFDAGDCVFPFPNEAYVMDVSRAAAAGVLPVSRPLASAIDVALDALRAEPERRVWQRTAAERAWLHG